MFCPRKSGVPREAEWHFLPLVVKVVQICQGWVKIIIEFLVVGNWSMYVFSKNFFSYLNEFHAFGPQKEAPF